MQLNLTCSSIFVGWSNDAYSYSKIISLSNEDIALKEGTAVYPNPIQLFKHETVTIRLDETRGGINIELLNTLGKVLTHCTFNEKDITYTL